MALWKTVFACTLAVGLSNCQKKSENVGNQIREAGYEMTADGWFDAVRANDVAVMRKMKEGSFDTKVVDAEGNGALHIAAEAGAKDAAELLIHHGFPLDVKGEKGRTPLMQAVLADKPDMVQYLLSQGADSTLKDDGGSIALMLAVINGSKKSVEELAAYHRESLDDALLVASLVGQAEMIDTLTNYGASVYARMEDGRTPLMLAAQMGHKDAAALLIDIGASRFATIESGDTAQSLAIAAGHPEIAKLIADGFSKDKLALESDTQIAQALVDDTGRFLAEPEEAMTNGGAVGKSGRSKNKLSEQGGVAIRNWGRKGSGAANSQEIVRSLEGASIGKFKDTGAGDKNQKIKEPVRSLSLGKPKDTKRVTATARDTDLSLVMRGYRQRELPVLVRKVSGNVASLYLPGMQSKEVQVSAGNTIPGSDLFVVKAFTRTEQGKLNNGKPIYVGVVQVEDKKRGIKTEWLQGRPASGHEPVALVEDATTGQWYVAKPGQKFHSEDGREFFVNDVRPTQIVIQETATGAVSTLRLLGARG